MSGGYQEQGEKRTRRIGAVIPLRRLERPVLTMTVGHMLAELGGQVLGEKVPSGVVAIG